jgi:hypothetical protein
MVAKTYSVFIDKEAQTTIDNARANNTSRVS